MFQFDSNEGEISNENDLWTDYFLIDRDINTNGSCQIDKSTQIYDHNCRYYFSKAFEPQTSLASYHNPDSVRTNCWIHWNCYSFFILSKSVLEIVKACINTSYDAIGWVFLQRWSNDVAQLRCSDSSQLQVRIQKHVVGDHQPRGFCW